jgi:hypothetical protein
MKAGIDTRRNVADLTVPDGQGNVQRGAGQSTPGRREVRPCDVNAPAVVETQGRRWRILNMVRSACGPDVSLSVKDSIELEGVRILAGLPHVF